MENTKIKQKLGIKDIATVSAMMVICVIINMVVSSLLMAMPTMYLYFSAGLEGFLGASFYLVAANRINKKGLIFIWCAVYGLLQGVMGYIFMLPYFLVIGLIAELTMVGHNTYRNPVRNMISWVTYWVGMFIGNCVPLWWAWESYRQMAEMGGFPAATLDMQLKMTSSIPLMLLGACITIAITALGVTFGNKLLRKHFNKAGIIK